MLSLVAAIFQNCCRRRLQINVGICLSDIGAETLTTCSVSLCILRQQWHKDTRLYALCNAKDNVTCTLESRIFLSIDYLGGKEIRWRIKQNTAQQWQVYCWSKIMLQDNLQLHQCILRLPASVKYCGFSSGDDEARVQLVSWTIMLSQWLCKWQSQHKVNTKWKLSHRQIHIHREKRVLTWKREDKCSAGVTLGYCESAIDLWLVHSFKEGGHMCEMGENVLRLKFKALVLGKK